MVEFCFTAKFLKVLNRIHMASVSSDAKERLDNLMKFLKSKVKRDQRINLLVVDFGLVKKKEYRNIRKRKGYTNVDKHLPAAVILLTISSKQDLRKNCVFCNRKHLSSKCFSA